MENRQTLSVDEASSLQSILDERAIFTLLGSFDDAANHRNEEAFRNLWTPDGIWEIGEPLPMHAEGVDNIVSSLHYLLSLNVFFFRITGLPHLVWTPEQVIARSPTIELGRREDGTGYQNVAVYNDVIVRHEGSWRFARRHYHYIWVDRTSPLAGESVKFP